MTRICRRSLDRGGMGLLVVLVALVLLAAFALAATALLRSTLMLTRTATETQEAMAGFDQAMLLLRTDAWGAASIEAAEPSQVDLRRGDQIVRWRSGADGVLSRAVIADGSEQITNKWERVGGPMGFSVSAAVLSVQPLTTVDAQRPPVVLASQVMLAREAAP